MIETGSSPLGEDGIPLLDVRGLTIESRMNGVSRTLVRDLNLHVEAGESVGIVGESGSGKSLTARAIMRLLPTGVFASGEVRFEGSNLLELSERRMRSVRGDGMSLLFQDPFTMLNPLMRVGPQIADTAGGKAFRKLSCQALRQEIGRILAEVEIRDADVADRYPFELSGGMRQRVGLAAALAGRPRLLVADEPSTALDVTTQKEVLSLLASLQRSRGMGLVLITHDLRVAFSVCDRLYVLYAGSALEVAGSRSLEEEPLHPYSLGLLLSEPPADCRVEELPVIRGSVPSADDVRGRCPFSPRCQWVGPQCEEAAPQLREVAPGRMSACARVDEIRDEMRLVRGGMRLDRKIVRNGKSRPTQATDGDAFLRVEGLSKTFRPKTGGDVRALVDVSLSIGEGESVGLVGESGSGKSTLARCLVGLETADSGKLWIDSVDVSNYARASSEDLASARRKVQIVFQDPYSSLNPARTVGTSLEEVFHVLRGMSRKQARAEVATLLERVGLPRTYVSRKPAALSGGERQRVAIARALAMAPKLLVCDEPVSALDVSVQAQILNILRDLHAELGLAYLFITHDLSVVRQVTDRIYVLYKGEIVESGEVEDTLDKPKHAYTQRLIDSVPRSDAHSLVYSASAG